MNPSDILATHLVDLMNASGLRDGGADYRVTVTDKDGNVAEVQMVPNRNGARQWAADAGFDSDVAIARLGIRPANYLAQAAVEVGDQVVIAGRVFRRSLFTGTTWCSGCSSVIRSAAGGDTFYDDVAVVRLCVGCGAKLAGLRLHRQFRHASWRTGDDPAECIILKISATSVVYERTNGRGEACGDGAVSDLVGFVKRLGAWL